MLLACAAFVAMQALVKSVRERGLDPSEVMFFRTAPGLPLLFWALRRRGESVQPDRPGNLFVRSLFGSLAMATNFTSLRSLSLSQFSTLGLSQPVFVALASPLLLKERVRGSTWLAMTLAFAGAYVLLSRDVNAQDVPLFAAALGLTSALASAFAMIWVRKSTESDPPERVVFHFAAWVSLGSLAVGLSRGYFVSMWSAPELGSLLVQIAGMAACGTAGQVLMTRAYVYGEATAVSMVGYSTVLMSMLLDLTVWGVAPGPGALLGSILMLAAAVVIVRAHR
jgi:drug/metabolite transporter (DMT)-like permease